MLTVSKISFGDASNKRIHSDERHRERPLLSSIAQMTDEEIIEASVRKANEKAENSKAASVLKNGPLLFIAATSIASGVLTKGSLASKAASSLKTLAAASVIYSLAEPVSKAVAGGMEKVSKDKSDKKEEKNPLVSFALNVAALGAASYAAIKAAKFGGVKIANKFAPTADAIKDTIANGAKALNSSKLGKFTENASEQFSHFSKVHPKLASVTTSLVGLLPAVGFVGGSLALGDKVVENRDKEAYSNINKLVLCREFAKTAFEAKEKADKKAD